MNRIFLIAEIGCNHCGRYDLAVEMIKAAKICGVDAVKFQTFKADELISKYAPKAEYQIQTTGADENQLEMTRKLELPYESYLGFRITTWKYPQAKSRIFHILKESHKSRLRIRK